MRTINARVFGASMMMAGLLVGVATTARAQTCAFPAATDFKVVEVMKGMTDPSHMAVLPDGQVFAIEQWSGKVWLHVPGKGASVIGTVPSNKGRSIEDGMLGIVADLRQRNRTFGRADLFQTDTP